MKCSIEFCPKDAKRKGWCERHYSRWYRHGDPMAGARDRLKWPDALLRRLRFMPDGCIEYTGPTNADGYGQISRGGRPIRAHRAAYEMVRGSIDNDLELHHLCENKACVNPGHLEPISKADHARQHGRRNTPTECPHGHAYDEANTGFDRHGWRYCRACARERMRRSSAA